MSLSVLSILFLGFLALGYRIYGRFISRQFEPNDDRNTPAVEINDGVDFVPTRKFYLLGQHFSAIAAAGPIAGPILACQVFGWLPCLLWIAVGVMLIGAVHDYASLMASVRHQGRSIAQIAKETMGDRAWWAMMIFIWVALIYVIVAFTDITASTFVGKSEELEGGLFTFNPGGAVAAASAMYLLLSILMGIVERFLKPPLWLMTILFVPATLGVVWFGTQISTLLILDQKTWGYSILLYCGVASLLPVWLLLQPRGYLGGFVLYMALAVGTIGLFFGNFPVEQEMFKTWQGPGMAGGLFPFLFVTIACGACSGFHGLVCSGTTSKQIARESDCRTVGFGGMLLEAFVALIALATIMIVAPAATQGKSPGIIYGQGLARFLTVMIGDKHLLFATTFGAMAFSTFVFDTLDVSTRLGRYILEELCRAKGRTSAVLATLATIGVPAIFLLFAGEGSYRLFWILFGTSNQLLAALSLLAVAVWLKVLGKKTWYVLGPMLFVMAITLWSLILQMRAGFSGGGQVLTNAIVAGILLVLALFLMYEGGRIVIRSGGVRSLHKTK